MEEEKTALKVPIGRGMAEAQGTLAVVLLGLRSMLPWCLSIGFLAAALAYGWIPPALFSELGLGWLAGLRWVS